MSSIKTTQIDGDVSVGRNVSLGGKADIAGSVSIGHNLKVDGWLEAPNIKGVNKGIFLTVQELREAYPNPHDGWMAGVGASTPFTAYVGKGGDWVATGGTIEVNVDMSQYTKGVAQLQKTIDEVATAAQDGVNAINGKLGVANGIATLDANGLLTESQNPVKNNMDFIEDEVKKNFLIKDASLERSAQATRSYIDTDGSVHTCSSSNFIVDTYQVNGNTGYYINYITYNLGPNVSAWGAVYDSQGNTLEVLGLLKKNTDTYTDADKVRIKTYITPAAAAYMKFFYIVSGKVGGVELKLGVDFPLQEKITNLENSVSDIIYSIHEKITPESVTENSVIDVDGTVTTIQTTGYVVAEFDVLPETNYFIDYHTYRFGASVRAWGAVYDSDDNVIEVLGLLKKSSDEYTEAEKVRQERYLTPHNAAKLRLGYNNTDNTVSELNSMKKNGLMSHITALESAVISLWRKMNNPSPDLRRANLKVLMIGNSYMENATASLADLATAASLNLSDMCVYKVFRSSASFKSWYNLYHDNDTNKYRIEKFMGGLTVKGFDTGTYNGDEGTQFRNVLSAGLWDIIVIQQVSKYSTEFDAWEGNGNDGYLTEWLRILRTLQPQASIGFMLSHASPDQSPDGTLVRAEAVAEATKRFSRRYAADFIIPYGIAVENLRESDLNTTSNGFTNDNHHLADGMGKYVASAATFQVLLAPRYGVSVLGNSYTVTVPQSKKDNYPDYEDNFVDVDATNKYEAQMCAILAANDMYVVNKPDDIEL